MKQKKRLLPPNLTENTASKCFVFRHKLYHNRKSVPFSYARGGDREKAKKKAVHFTLKMNSKLGIAPRKSSVDRMTTRNRSGKVNVFPKRDLARRNGLYYYFWLADWKGCPQAGGVGWPCLTHTDEGAYVLASLTHDMRTIDRDRVLEAFEKIRGTKEYKTMLAQKPKKPIADFWND